MKNILVIYHSADLDGICSREVARKALGDTADYLGWDYGRDIPDLAPYTTVYLIDISLPPAVMAKHVDRLIWIDHHKSAIEAMKGIDIRGLRIDGVAACRLAWQFMVTGRIGHPKQDYLDRVVLEPYAVRLLGEYDIWDKRDPNTDLFQLGMQAQRTPPWFVLFDVATDTIQQIINDGRAIQAYTDVVNAQIATERGFDAVFEGLTFRALNTARSSSLTFTAALQPHHDGCLSYFWNGRKWRFSLYHAPGKEAHDLSRIATKFGGGGHRGACGFELKQLPAELGGYPLQLIAVD